MIKNDNVISQHGVYITKSLQMFEDIYKLMTDKLQLVLINVLIRSIFEHKSSTR